MMKRIYHALVLALIMNSTAWAITQTLNFQGFLKESGASVTGTRDMTFKIFDVSSGGSALYTDADHTSSNGHAVIVSTGIFNVMIGEYGSIPLSNYFDGGDRYIEVTVGAGSPMPRQKISSVGYAIFAATAATLSHNASIQISSAVLTATGATQYSLQTSSGINVQNGGVTAPFFVGNGAGLTGLSGTDSSKVAKAGDTMTGQLTLSGAPLTVIGGKIGVGTTTPTGLLTIQGENNASRSLVIGEATTGSPIMTFEQAGVERGYAYYNNATSRLTLNRTGSNLKGVQLDSVDNVLLSPGGLEKVGIGMTSPSTTLDVAGGIKAATMTTTGQNNFSTGAGGTFIGSVNTPSAKLDVSASGSTVAVFEGYAPISGNSANSGSIALGVTTADQGLLQYDGSAGVLYIENTYNYVDADIKFRTKTAGTPVTPLTLKAGGDVGIGTTSPQAKLDVVNTSAGAEATSILVSNNSSSVGTESAIGFSAYTAGSGETGRISCVQDSSTHWAMKFWTHDGASLAERMRIHTNGNVGIGTTNPGASLDVAGTGIKVTSMTVNGYDILGAWTDFTPSLAGYGGMTVTGGTVARARYLLMGRTMCLGVYVYNLTIGGTLTTDIQMTIPAGKASSSPWLDTAALYNNGTFEIGRFGTAGAGQTTAFFNRMTAGNWSASTANTHISINGCFDVQ